MYVRKKHIEALADDILRESGIVEPPIPVEAIARQHGLEVRYQPLESNLSGFLYPFDGHAVIGVNTAHPKVRQRFTIAHEFAHFMLRHDDTLHVDRGFPLNRGSAHSAPSDPTPEGPGVLRRDELSSKGTDVREREANLLAAELLMPRQMLSEDWRRMGTVDITDEEAIMGLARRYSVSTQALVLRLSNLGLFEQ